MTPQHRRALWLVRGGVVGVVLVVVAVSLFGLGAEHTHGDLRMVDGSGEVVATSPGSTGGRAMLLDAGSFTFELADAGSEAHSFTLVRGESSESGGEVVATVSAAPGEPGAQRRLDLAPGTYTLFCTTPGHADAGMTYEIEVR